MQIRCKKQVEAGKAPREVDRVDKGNPDIPNNKDHVHFKDDTALNYDGTLSHEGKGIPKITKGIRTWLAKNGWQLPE